jgi:uncharacterized protein YcbK (DUF882 family)
MIDADFMAGHNTGTPRLLTPGERRNFLKVCAGIAMSLPGASYASNFVQPERKLGFYNTHTGDTLTTTYWADGEYIHDSLDEINHVLRDHRTGDVYPINPDLLDILYVLQLKVERRDPFSIISGYRSPKTNAMLNKTSSGVAKRSLHMQGKAIDIRLPGCELAYLRKAAMSLKSGGVGYYPSSDFIHVDIGRVRYW